MKPFKRIVYGADYYPEQWPESIWEEDLKLMQQAGINFIRLGVFAWAKLNPRPGVYTFEWMDRVMEIFANSDIDICLATATGTPPAWLSKLDPEVLPKDANLLPWHFGSRQAYSAHSATFRKYAGALTDQISTRYKDHPRLRAWNVGNEFMGHIRDSLTDADREAFREWLKNRYSSLDELNERWGTTFWSHTYHEWEEIDGPLRTLAYRCPALELDWRRFMSESYLEVYQLEAAILRKNTPAIPVTTNYMVFDYGTDVHRWSPHLDFLCWDSYPDLLDQPRSYHTAAAMHDLVRAAKGGAPWMLMEQTPSRTQWRPVNPLKQPGRMRLWSLAALARGADGVAFFQWRQSRSGAEKFHGAIVPHGDPARDRTFREISELGQELKNLNDILDTRVAADIGILFDYENRWAVERESKPIPLDYISAVTDWSAAIYDLRYTSDLIAADASFTPYKAIFCPLAYLFRNETAQALTDYVSNGGTLIIGYFSGIVDECEQVYAGGYPGPLRELCGLTVAESQVYPNGAGNSVRFADGERSACDFWCDILDPQGAEVIATYESDFFARAPALCLNRVGKGRVYYCGSRLAPQGLRNWFQKILELARAKALLPLAPHGIETTVRVSEQAAFLFIVNHNGENIRLSLDAFSGTDLLTGSAVSGSLTLNPYGVAIVRLNDASATGYKYHCSGT